MSPVEFLSALVAPATATPAPQGEAGDAAAFERAVAAAAKPEAASAATWAPKKHGFLHGLRMIQAGAPEIIEARPEVLPATAPASRSTPDAPIEAPAEAGEEFPALADPGDRTAETADTAPVVPPAAAPAPAVEASAGTDETDEDEGAAAVERTLAALLDRILLETGASKGDGDPAERLEAAQEAIARVMDQAPPHVRPKLEALLARMAAAAETAASEAPAETEEAGAAQPFAVVEAGAHDEAAAEAVVATPVQTPQTALTGQSRRLTGTRVLHDVAASPAVGAGEARAAARDEAAMSEVPPPADEAKAEAAKPASSADAAPSAGPAKAAPAGDKAAAEPAASPTVQVEAPVDAVAPADTAAGAPAAHAGAHATVAAAVRGSPETVAHLSAEILKKLEGRSTRFDMELHPADLGRVDVRLTIEADGRLNAQLAFDNPVAAADLRARADELRRSLEQAGFQVSEDSFSFAERGGDGRSFEDTRQQFADGGRARARAFRAGGETADLADAPPVARRAVRLGVDVRI